MMTNRVTSSENDVLYEFALNYRHPNPEQLDQYVRQYPQHAESFTAFAIELAMEADLKPKETQTDELDPETENMLSLAMSRFQNRVYAVRAALSPEAAPRLTLDRISRDPFSSRTQEEIQILVVKLDVTPIFLIRLRDCGIRSDTMTPGFIRYLAEEMREPEDVLLAHFAARQRIHSQVKFKASITPTAGVQISFEEAVRSSGLSAKQQAKLLAL